MCQIHYNNELDELKDIYEKVYKNIKKNATLKNYINNIIFFNDAERIIHYITEGIYPRKIGKRTPVVLLFSNPHPNSLQKGIFLAGVSRFWKGMQESGMITFRENIKNPTRLTMEQLLNLDYDSSFAFYFYCFFDFPSRFPDQLKNIFDNYFNQYLKYSYNRFSKLLRQKKVKNIICFGKQAFKYIYQPNNNDELGQGIRNYTNIVRDDGYVLRQLNEKIGLNNRESIKLYFTYPTGHGNYNRTCSLKKIKTNIL